LPERLAGQAFCNPKSEIYNPKWYKVPIYLADEVVEFFAKRAEAKGVELSELLNDVLKQDVALLEKMQ
jgi:hypothetical protein